MSDEIICPLCSEARPNHDKFCIYPTIAIEAMEALVQIVAEELGIHFGKAKGKDVMVALLYTGQDENNGFKLFQSTKVVNTFCQAMHYIGEKAKEDGSFEFISPDISKEKLDELDGGSLGPH